MKINLPKNVEYIIHTLNKNNFSAYAVGGCIRDILINKEPKDWDITTNALPEDIIKIFKDTVPTGIKHGTITVLINGTPYEVTTFRIDGKYTDNRHPDSVIFSNSLYEDLSRRDFTINSISYNHKDGLQDPFNGKNDLQQKIIRCVGTPDLRFKEDSLRILRAIRFSTQLNFKIEQITKHSLQKNSLLIKNVSMERIRDELSKILLTNKPSVGFQLLKETKLLEIILPELSICVGFNQHNPHHYKDIFDHTMMVLDNTSSNLIIRIAALLHDIGKPKCFSIDKNGIGHFYMHNIEGAKISQEILSRLKFDNKTIKTVYTLIKEHLVNRNNLKIPAIKRFINRVGIDNLNYLFDLQIADIKGHTPPHDFSPVFNLKISVNEILAKKDPLNLKDLDITGNDLIKIGYSKGIIIGKTLNELLELVIKNPELNKKNILIPRAIKKLNYKK
ncbi:CCA-adding enzyme [Clostridium pasteurianum DSM 525 = ATCC 6013]|uniref:CCA-adding enzyme n=1 Tax=Clostridium pasteurianum DSM 525 = ATCC 6013 TaxID=1262449 RepID=A0A0H3J0L4_CLOPA|nr:CCA tRNA nucleotidyltransferase [Clostridium pasteurianum]AJA46207.1 CCA-adding enzyme [Clostridium pasteurianum DSM 525 = ATCC 6013]AJA50195.1 CCA-adding enzyme [Clostridium pasteurianum DSM 525 = ATCC 6013]AOZ73663.1 polynucleotide adenylyltransferase [Clostridium pasteurianum DSM 525 = ATCC 6013]AOZ77460.1 polynucleotide adenylyltransferase [Clostridium pasteurianum]ELP57466.1 polyA polymerase family protein [Clostridium pasteurianum DSM 525 = ATCC 6013]